MPNISRSIRLNTEWRFSKTPPGAACTAWDAGVANCGCNSGGRGDWNQEWRAPLRAALDWLRDEVAPAYEKAAARYLKDPWAARNDYIDVILDRSPESRERFGVRHFRRKNLQRADRVHVWKLLELQRHAMLMYTSCGWFFDELSGIETVQVIQYAGRVVQLAQELFDDSIESRFLEKLALAKSNIPEHAGRREHLHEIRQAGHGGFAEAGRALRASARYSSTSRRMPAFIPTKWIARNTV